MIWETVWVGFNALAQVFIGFIWIFDLALFCSAIRNAEGADLFLGFLFAANLVALLMLIGRTFGYW